MTKYKRKITVFVNEKTITFVLNVLFDGRLREVLTATFLRQNIIADIADCCSLNFKYNQSVFGIKAITSQMMSQP